MDLARVVMTSRKCSEVRTILEIKCRPCECEQESLESLASQSSVDDDEAKLER